MEQSGPARHSSNIYDANYGSQHSFESDTELREHAEPPAGITRTTAAGVPVTVAGGPEGGSAIGWNDTPETPPQPQQPPIPLYKRRWFIITSIVVGLLGIALLFIILFPVIHAIVQLVVKRTQIDVERAVISNASNNTFELLFQGNVTHTGIISASIKFTENIDVYWLPDPDVDKTGIKLGHTTPFEELHATHKRAKINQTQTFTIENQTAFSDDNLRVQALKFPVAKGIGFDKRVDLKGINSFSGDIKLLDFKLPSDNPAGGLDFVALTQLNNQSPFVLQLGTTVFDLSYQNVSLGSGTSTNTVIDTGLNNITLKGVLQPIQNTADLPKISTLFTNYLNGDSSPVVASGRSTFQDDGTIIQWLSDGLQSLQLNVPFKSSVPIDPIRAVDIDNLALVFSPETPWTPAASSNSVRASLVLPFGFSLAIDEIQNQFNIVQGDAPVAGLATPLGASTSSIMVFGEADTQGMINIVINNTNLTCPDAQHPTFSAFNANLTSADVTEFRLIGSSRAVANLSIGQITLDPIKVNVSSQLRGLQGLRGLTQIEGVDVAGGTTDHINLNINVTIQNPSNLNISTGDLTLQLLRDGVPLGTALLPALNLRMGNNTISATSAFRANDNAQGLQTLNDFVGKKDVGLTISGFDGSTNIPSLSDAFKTLSLDVTLPGMKTNLLERATLKVLPTTGRENNISHVTVFLDNPFTAPLHITSISSTITSHGIPLGTINTNTDFRSAPLSTTQSPELELNMNFDPAALFTVTRLLAVEAGLDIAPLDGIVQLGGIQYLPPVSGVSTKRQDPGDFIGFNLPNFIQTAFKQLQSDVQLESRVSIGDYITTLQYTQMAIPTATDETLNLILPILAQPIVERIVSGAGLGIETVMITDPEEDSFGTQLQGSINNAGPFNAQISFPSGLNVAWQGNTLGNIEMEALQVVGGVGATLNAASTSTFNVISVDALAEFTEALLTQESFDWEISGENLTVKALGIDVPGIQFPAKKVNLKGFNGLQGGVKIQNFDLPEDDQEGGIHLTLEVSTTSPSDVGIQLNTLGFNTFSGNTMLGPVAATNGATLAPRATSNMSLAGRLVPQDSQDGLNSVSQIFNNFVAGKPSNVMVQGAAAGPSTVTWLNRGIKALKVGTILPDRGPQDLITSITLNQMGLKFTEASAFSPLTSSSSTDAAFTLPFGFSIDIAALEQTIKLGLDGPLFAQLTTPMVDSTTENRTIHLAFPPVPLTAFQDQHPAFEGFLAATTMGTMQMVSLVGFANTKAITKVGPLSLTNIQFSVKSPIAGLQGLATKPVVVKNLDVNHGFSTFLLIKVDSTLFNPSNLTIEAGDVAFDLLFQDHKIGTANVANLMIIPGEVALAIDVHFAPQGDAIQAGRTLLQSFLEGIDSDTAIVGSDTATPIESLKTALKQIRLAPVTIPALNRTLITSVSLSFPIDIVDTGNATATFMLSNPFTASINLLRVGAKASFHNISLGEVPNVDESDHPIRAEGHTNITSPPLPFKFNLDPVVIISLLRQAAAQNGVSLGPLDALFQFVLDNPNFKPPVKTSVDTSEPTCVSGHQFDAADAILKSLAHLQVDLDVDTGTKLDDFATDLTFSQKSVPAITDKTALFLIGAVAGPVAQHLVDGAVLAFTEASISNITDDGFDISLKGSLTNVGPLDALIEFIEPLNVTWQGKQIAKISLPSVCAAADDGVPDYQTKGHLTITNQDDFTAFAEFLLHSEQFEWTISTDKLRLRALGTIFDNVFLEKSVSFKAFNNLPGVSISNFQLPSDDPAGGIHVETDAIIPSPAQLAIELGHVAFQAFFEDVLVGPLAAENLTLVPQAVTKTHLSGRIVPQSGDDLEVIGKLFSEFLAGHNTTLQTRGDSVQPPGADGPITWLSTAFKTLSLDVVLPGQKFDVIKAIQLNDLEVTIQTADQAFAPPTGSKNTVAQYANPFGFPLQVIEAAQSLILNLRGVDVAQLDLPKQEVNGGVSTGNTVDLVIAFENQTLKSLNNDGFSQVFAGATLMTSVDINLKGSADVTAKTSIGNVPITGIPIDVVSTLKGIGSFGHQATLSNVSVTGSGGQGGNEYIISPLTTALENPSNISLSTVDVSLPVIFQGTKIGRAAINTFNLVPGENSVATEFHYEPDNANDTVAQGFLTQFIQTGDKLDLTIDGDAQSSPFGSLQPALDGVTISTSLTGLNHPAIIVSAHVIITLDSLVTNLVSVEFSVQNPLNTDMVIEFAQADSGLDGIIYAAFGQSFDSFVIPAGQTVGSGLFPNVLLTQGAIASLDIIPRQMLDISAANTVRIGGPGGYQIPWLKLEQKGVPTTYDLVLSLGGAKMTVDGFRQKAKDILGPHPNSTVASSASVVQSTSAGSDASTSASASVTGSDLGVDPTTAKVPVPTPQETASAGEKDADAPPPTTAQRATTQAAAEASPSQATPTAAAFSPKSSSETISDSSL